MKLLVAVILTALVACGGDDSTSSSTTYASAEEIAETLQEAGIVCEGSSRRTRDRRWFEIEGVPDPIDEGTCTDAEYDIEISVYASEGREAATGRASW